MKLMLLATALGVILAGAAAPAIAQTGNPVGFWRTEDGAAVIEVAPCGEALCGRIASLSDRSVQRDNRNRDPAKRTRPLCGVPILGGFVAAGQARWRNGWIYDPESGETYRGASLTLAGDTLEIVVISGSDTASERWRRTRPANCGGA